jgi:hypothetical protein
MKQFRYLLGLLMILFFSSCEDEIDLDLDVGPSQLVVDAWLNDYARDQQILLSLSGDYKGNNQVPVVDDAQVVVFDDEGNQFEFLHQEEGRYVYKANGQPLVQTGHYYTLQINYRGSDYQASSYANPVPTVDSIGYELDSRGSNPFNSSRKPGYVANFTAIDLPGQPDYYWIRYYRNNKLINNPSRVLLAINSLFNNDNPEGDGLMFIVPIRFSVNAPDRPYKIGDKITVEIYALTKDSWEFLDLTRDQLNNGGLFARPIVNVPTNILNLDKNAPREKQALGWFSVSSASNLSRVVTGEDGD